ncbi:chloroperoxidase-like protein [Amylocystis lapponica]|nr:chloroperoxidase-like protein [Amylocystis lapponica]
MSQSIVANALTRLFFALVSSIISTVLSVGILVWDLGLTLYNVVAPLRPADRVVPAGCLGEGGIWPQYVPPKTTDSRSCCPALNAMANHGILPHSGRGIRFREMNAAVRATYNFSPSFCFFVPHYIAQALGRSYWADTCDLADLSVHNCIEHDGSLTRTPGQDMPDVALVEELLAGGTGLGGDLTAADLARLLGKRRTEARQMNGQFSLSTFHKLFGSSNSSTLLTIYGGSVKDLRPILLEERLPDGWQPRVLHPMGLTIIALQKTVLRVEMGIKEEVESVLNRWRWSGGSVTASEGKKAA